MSSLTSSLEYLAAIASASLLAVVLCAGALIWRSERARGRALAELARVQERARAGEAAMGELVRARTQSEQFGREAAARAAQIDELKVQLAASAEEVRRLSETAGTLRDERDAHARTLERERAEARGLERQINDLKEAKEHMRQTFAENASALMQNHSESFKAQNREQLEALLGPLKADIARFNSSLSEQHGSLKEQIAHLSQQSADISKEAVALTRALKGNVQKQGAWGEMIVDTILARLGFREGVEFTRQETFSAGGERFRTDYVVMLPNGERIVIDSKVSLIDFERYVNATEEEAGAHLAAHARSMRAHMKGLAEKSYHTHAGSGLDFVIMFVPIEAALGAALQHDDTLCVDALERKIAIATPTTLTTQLQTIRALWKAELRNHSAEDIARRAGLLYDKFCGFVDDLAAVGSAVDRLQESFDGAMNKLSTGKGNLVRQVEILKEMGASTNKSLPPDLLAAAGADDSRGLPHKEAEPAVGRAPDAPLQ
jgi:DNA recombination protein RmuC